MKKTYIVFRLLHFKRSSYQSQTTPGFLGLSAELVFNEKKRQEFSARAEEKSSIHKKKKFQTVSTTRTENLTEFCFFYSL